MLVPEMALSAPEGYLWNQRQHHLFLKEFRDALEEQFEMLAFESWPNR